MCAEMESRQIAKIQEIRPPVNQCCGHAVQFYENDPALIWALGQHLGAALESGDTVIVVATKEHNEELAEELRLLDIDTAAAVNAGRYLEFDAVETLARIMTGERPDPQKFEDTIGTLVRRAAAGMPGHRVVIFGEMVALLWAEGKRDATVRLEELWNDLAQRSTFHLLCGYPTSAFDSLEHRQHFFNICGEHTHINPESYAAEAGEAEWEYDMAPLQQKTRTLENEIRISQERGLLAQKVTNAGTWELDVVNDTFSFSSAAAKLLGLELSGHARLSQLMDLMYYSGDRDAVMTHLQAAQRHRKDFATTFRVRHGDDTRIIAIQGKTFFNSGTPIMLGVLSDVTPAAAETSAVEIKGGAAKTALSH
jgi:PAS domain-containing protein